ncbi:SCO family protein [Ferdinandcohnia quinoae]|uniref:SCO family protein n=1 Tax=Fredinandcohnia quinoae TaxID=2918902 RepID=A0AAW5DYY5_9BACI|nr:SCO family protein [Fredinandcohnia sp. SECRCQ15]MCH1625861.1 SCO family protein [Fredinandcohnia sp. SECRCQ15]
MKRESIQVAMRKGISILLVVIAGFSLLWLGTDGFRAYTAETARFIHLQREQPELPMATLIDSEGENFRIDDIKGKYLLLTFMYTACGDLCPVLESNFAEIYNGIPKEVLGDEVLMLSISFDPERDTPETLKTYGNYYGADGIAWKMVTIQDVKELKDVLDTLEVIVIPNEYGGYEHNSAFYVINPDGKLTNIFDFQRPQSVLTYLDAVL